jgi:hypothetical protein
MQHLQQNYESTNKLMSSSILWIPNVKDCCINYPVGEVLKFTDDFTIMFVSSIGVHVSDLKLWITENQGLLQ